MELPVISTSLEETYQIAFDFASKLELGTTICLRGDLAAGKTTFTQGLGTFFGINRVISPTFIVMREYPVTNHPTIKRLFHLDLYRLDSPRDIKSFDLDEIWNDPSNLLVIEWPEKIETILPTTRYDITLKATGEDQREITITHQK